MEPFFFVLFTYPIVLIWITRAKKVVQDRDILMQNILGKGQFVWLPNILTINQAC